MRCRPAIVIMENDHVLLMRYQFGSGMVYNFPGGNPDPGEIFTETIIRECREELAVEVEVGKLLLMGEIPGKEDKKSALHILFEGSIVSGIPILQAHETTAQEICWIPISQLASLHLYPNVGVALQDLVFLQKKGEYVGAIQQPWVD
ncbi:NUDIX domain-containing protein [Aquirufa nivalisilvae]|uniref:8-oxo-dGTP diphosphatase n=1 Tax=Aquirufa nivalisilvae TaxID=2516557 RepID=A0A2S2DST2_9BACT|nr:NUDIX domain-containing protein [Aquirufa nivalisilvae]AWL08454.1 8-oxo-dGTP diphosphatase [Aquirufa nivalisilvae]